MPAASSEISGSGRAFGGRRRGCGRPRAVQLYGLQAEGRTGSCPRYLMRKAVREAVGPDVVLYADADDGDRLKPLFAPCASLPNVTSPGAKSLARRMSGPGGGASPPDPLLDAPGAPSHHSGYARSRCRGISPRTLVIPSAPCTASEVHLSGRRSTRPHTFHGTVQPSPRRAARSLRSRLSSAPSGATSAGTPLRKAMAWPEVAGILAPGRR